MVSKNIEKYQIMTVLSACVPQDTNGPGNAKSIMFKSTIRGLNILILLFFSLSFFSISLRKGNIFNIISESNVLKSVLVWGNY